MGGFGGGYLGSSDPIAPAAALTVGRAVGVVAGVEVEVVTGGDEVVWARDVALLQGCVEPAVPVRAPHALDPRKAVWGDVEGGLESEQRGEVLNATTSSAWAQAHADGSC